MASDDLLELIKIGPFLGIDQSTNELEMKPGFALQSTNCNTSIIQGALLPERGRTELLDVSGFNFGGDSMTSITIIYPCVGDRNSPGILFQGPGVVNTVLTGYYDYLTATFTNIAGARKFTQAIQFLNVVYTNAGQRYFPGLRPSGVYTPSTNMFAWQYDAPIVAYREAPVFTDNGVEIVVTYAIATLGFHGHIKFGDILTTTITTSGPVHAIPYTVVVTDTDFAILSKSISDAINVYFASGAGSGEPQKVTATALVDFDMAANPGTLSTLSPNGILLSSNQSGMVGSTYTVSVSMSAGATEGYVTTGRTSLTYPVDSVTGQFFGTNSPFVNVGDILGGFYFYLFTRQTTMPDGTVSETSVLPAAIAGDIIQFPAAFSAPLQVDIGGSTYGSNSSVTFVRPLTAGPGFAYVWAGTNADGSTFVTNIYRASTLQKNFIYQLVGTVSVQPAPGAVAFVDRFSDNQISGNAILETHRDPPPFIIPHDPITNPNNTNSNLGFMAVHDNRIFILVQQNAKIPQTFMGVTNNIVQPQVQLWYSNFDRGWEFNDVSQVLLLESDVVSTQSDAAVDYDAFYGNMPKGLCEVGTTLMAVMKRVTWVVWGDGTDANPFTAKPVFSYGALASLSGILGVRGGMYFITESGDLYFYDGNAPKSTSGDISGLTKLSSVQLEDFSYDDLATSCLAYAFENLYWCFPNKGLTLSYSIENGRWMSQLPYSPAGRYGIFSSPWNPTTPAELSLNEVIAVRNTLPTVIDNWFADTDQDIGSNMQLFTWTTPHTDSGKPQWRKWYKLLRVMAPKQKAIVTVDLMIDNDDDVTHMFSKTIDLNGSQMSLTKKFQGDTAKIIGVYAQVKITVQSVPGEPAPIIWGVGIYGGLSDNLLVNPGE